MGMVPFQNGESSPIESFDAFEGMRAVADDVAEDQRFANVLVAQGVQDGVERREIGVNVSQQCEDLGAWRASSGSGRRCDRRDAGIAGCDLALGQCQYAAQSLRED